MSHRFMRIAALASFTVVAFPLAAPAQTATFFVPAKIIRNGTSTTLPAGKGTVTLKVFVRTNGTPDAARTTVVTSTNSGDNVAALEVAKSAKYKPAFTDGKPTGTYYTFKITFGDNGSSVSDETANGDLRKFATMAGAGNYAGAKAGLTEYLKTNPADPEANVLLGVADYYGQDYAGASAAFDKAGTIAAKYKALAGDAYTKAGTQALRDNVPDTAVAYCAKAIELAPSAEAYNTPTWRLRTSVPANRRRA